MFPPATATWKGLAAGRTLLPDFSLVNMVSYFVSRKVSDGQEAGDFKNINNRSYPLFKAGHIQRIKVIKGNDDKVYLVGVCLPEMRKYREYKIRVTLSPSGDTVSAEDGCPAGKGPHGSCKHIASFCYALEEFVRLGFTRPFQSCTSRLQTWNQPRPKKLKQRNVYDIPFENAKYRKELTRERSSLVDYNAIPTRYCQEKGDATNKLSELCKKLTKPCAFFKALKKQPEVEVAHSSVVITNAEPCLMNSELPTNGTASVNSVCSPVLHTASSSQPLAAPISSVPLNMLTTCPTKNAASGSILPANPPSGPAKPGIIPGSVIASPPTSPAALPNNNPPVFPIRLPLVNGCEEAITPDDLPDDLPAKARMLYEEQVRVDLIQAQQIEEATRNQAQNKTWFRHRQCRLTASNFGSIIKRKKEDCTKLVKRLTSSMSVNLNVRSLNYGRDNEDAVAQYYQSYQQNHGHPGTQVFKCGLVVNPKHSWLGASLDRTVYDPSATPSFGGLEIKCIESGKGMTPMETYCAKREPDSGKKRPFCLMKESNKLKIDHKHNYFYQVQGQAAISGLKWIDFVVMTDLELGDEGIFLQRIYADHDAWQSILLPKLSKFYFSSILPALLARTDDCS